MQYYTELKNAVLSENLFETEIILEKVCDENDSIDYIPKILTLMENNSDLDFGMPGPLVHFVETFYHKGYELFLEESIIRKPTMHTLWMLRRIINDPALHDRNRYIELLKKIKERKDLNNDIKNEINDILMNS